MSHFENIDDYLSNRLPEAERASFEQAMAGDPALRKEVVFQEKVIGSVRHAREKELKQMLQQIPIPTGGISPGQLAAGIIATGVVVTGLYFFFRPEAPEPAPETTTAVPKTIVKPETEPSAKPETITAPAEDQKKKPAARKQTPSPVQKPDIQVADPTTELNNTEDPATTTAATEPQLTVSKLQVVTQAGDKKYSFHYQFAEGKLHLFGPFDRNLYEILEINGDSHAVFLYYKENYYLLDESKRDITPLGPIRDDQLLKKLREYRNR